MLQVICRRGQRIRKEDGQCKDRVRAQKARCALKKKAELRCGSRHASECRPGRSTGWVRPFGTLEDAYGAGSGVGLPLLL